MRQFGTPVAYSASGISGFFLCKFDYQKTLFSESFPVLVVSRACWQWQRLPPLLNDGYRYFRSRIGYPLEGDSDDYEAVAKLIKHQRRSESAETEPLQDAEAGTRYKTIDKAATGAADKSRRTTTSSDGEPKKSKPKKKKSPKPRFAQTHALLFATVPYCEACQSPLGCLARLISVAMCAMCPR